MRRTLALIALCCLPVACTDWDGQGGGTDPKIVGGLDPSALYPAAERGIGGDGGPTPYGTWRAPDGYAIAEVKDGAATPGDTAIAADATGTAPDALPDAAPAEVVVIGPDGSPVGADGVAAPDGNAPDAAGADAGATDVTVYSFDGKADFGGWPEVAPAKDVAAPDVPVAFDGGGADGGIGSDGGLPPLDGVVPPDDGATQPADVVVPTDDGGTTTIDVILPEPDVPPDASPADGTTVVDVGVVDVGGTDAGAVDLGVVDSSNPDNGATDSGGSETGVSDGSTGDGSVSDAGSTDGGVADTSGPDSGLPDGIIVPDWQGYPTDLPYGADADIYGGPIGSCLSMYLYQQESCGTNNPTAECINTIAKDGSLYAQFLFQPLQECETAVCTKLCPQATDKSCMESCVGKYCTTQFLACTSNASTGSANCADTWTCSQQFPNKLLTISAKCYANASFASQQKFAAMISCSAQPQTQSCVKDIAACYAQTPGVAACKDTVTCATSCAGDQVCANQCIAKGSAATLDKLDALLLCQLQNCNPKCKDSPDPKCGDTCMQQACSSQLVQCLMN